MVAPCLLSQIVMGGQTNEWMDGCFAIEYSRDGKGNGKHNITWMQSIISYEDIVNYVLPTRPSGHTHPASQIPELCPKREKGFSFLWVTIG